MRKLITFGLLGFALLSNSVFDISAQAASAIQINFVMTDLLTGKNTGSGTQIRIHSVNRDDQQSASTDSEGVARFSIKPEQYILDSMCATCDQYHQGVEYLIIPASDGTVKILSAADEPVVQDSKGNWIIYPSRPRSSVANDPWQLLTNQPNFGGVQLMFLLTNGNVLAQSRCGENKDCWGILSPDINGNYATGTWRKVASPTNYNPVTFNGAVLHSGNVLVVGGEQNYSDTGASSENTNMSELFNVTTEKWTEIPPPAEGKGDWAEIGSPPFIELADGRVMISFFGSNGQSTHNESMIFDEKTLSWTQAGLNKVGRNTEAGFTLLQNNKILTVNTSGNNGHLTSAEIYDPATDSWSSAGHTPTSLEDSEIGPALTLPNGKVLATGVTGNHALYDPISNSWSAVPSWPKLKNGLQLAADDNDAVILPNGNVLTITATFPRDTNNATSMAPAKYVEYDWASNTWLWRPDDLVSSSTSQCPNGTFMLPLPNGQILVSNNGKMELFTSAESSNPAWRPIVDKLSSNSISPGSTFSVSGKQLSGLTQGQQWGDEWEAATNYPLVRVVNNSTHHVFYATTSGFSSTSIAPLAPSAFDVTIGSDFENGPSQLYVVANGIASLPIDVTISGGSNKIAEEKAAADKAAADKAAADKAAADKAAADKAATDLLAQQKAVASKKIILTCVKGKLTKKVIAVKPACPKGYKKK